MTYPSVSDLGGSVSRAYRLTGVPETVVVDPQGRLVGLPQRGLDTPTAKFIGPILPTGRFTPSDLRRVLDGLLEGRANGPSTESRRGQNAGADWLAGLPEDPA